jgi:hypothetical protein
MFHSEFSSQRKGAGGLSACATAAKMSSFGRLQQNAAAVWRQLWPLDATGCGKLPAPATADCVHA